jgi:hypothetical protein
VSDLSCFVSFIVFLSFFLSFFSKTNCMTVYITNSTEQNPSSGKEQERGHVLFSS